MSAKISAPWHFLIPPALSGEDSATLFCCSMTSRASCDRQNDARKRCDGRICKTTPDCCVEACVKTRDIFMVTSPYALFLAEVHCRTLKTCAQALGTIDDCFSKTFLSYRGEMVGVSLNGKRMTMYQLGSILFICRCALGCELASCEQSLFEDSMISLHSSNSNIAKS